LSLEQDVILLDSVPRDRLPFYIKASNCVVVPSISEGFGFSVAESCAMGVPVAASNVGSIPEVISNKHILFNPADSSDIARALMDVKQGRLQFKPKKHFAWQRTVDEYEKIYFQLAGAR
jgi:glycosyltransferase involved in cell wall biosynthesis